MTAHTVGLVIQLSLPILAVVAAILLCHFDPSNLGGRDR